MYVDMQVLALLSWLEVKALPGRICMGVGKTSHQIDTVCGKWSKDEYGEYKEDYGKLAQ